PRHDRLARALAPLVAAVERLLAALQLLEARVGTDEVVQVLVVERRAEGDNGDPPALQHRQRFLDDGAMERRARSRLQLVRPDLDDRAHRRDYRADGPGGRRVEPVPSIGRSARGARRPTLSLVTRNLALRSEERRVGKESRAGWSADRR